MLGLLVVLPVGLLVGLEVGLGRPTDGLLDPLPLWVDHAMCGRRVVYQVTE